MTTTTITKLPSFISYDKGIINKDNYPSINLKDKTTRYAYLTINHDECTYSLTGSIFGIDLKLKGLYGYDIELQEHGQQYCLCSGQYESLIPSKVTFNYHGENIEVLLTKNLMHNELVQILKKRGIEV